MITENDKFEIPDKYKYMSVEEIRKEKEIIYHQLMSKKKDIIMPDKSKIKRGQRAKIFPVDDYIEISVCDDCEIGDGWECQFCCSKCYEDYGECPNPDCDPMDI